MGLFAGVMSGLVVLALAWRTDAGKVAGATPLLAGGLIAGLALLALFGGRVLERISGIENDAESRVELYRQTWGMIMSRPWTGFGGGSFEQAFQLFHAAPLSTDVVWDKAHSSYLTLAAELGLPVAIGVLLLLARVGLHGVSTLRFPEAGRRVPLAVAGVILVAALHSLVDFSLEIQANAYLFAALLGIGYGYREGVVERVPKP
jgi:O-antigen ligase